MNTSALTTEYRPVTTTHWRNIMAKPKAPQFVEVKSANVNGIFQVLANKGIAWQVQDEDGTAFLVQKRLVVRGPWEETEDDEPAPTPNLGSLAGQLAAAAATPKPAPKVKKDKPAPTERDPNLVTLKELCFELGIIPRIARRRLRKAVGLVGTGGRWEWKKDSPELAKVRQALAAPTPEAEADDDSDE